MANKTATHASEKGSAIVRKPPVAARASRRPVARGHSPAALARAMHTPASELSAGDILALQRTAGNRAVAEMLAQSLPPEPPDDERQHRLTLQAKLAVGAADDQYEREADRVAAEVMQTSAPPAARIQRQPSPEGEDDEKMVQRKPLAASITPLVQRREMPEKEDEEETPVQRLGVGTVTSAGPGVEQSIGMRRGSGASLPEGLRGQMEQAFGADFGGVRVHADAESDRLNGALAARAFTTGQDIFFKQGAYDPGSRCGQELIAHELTHIVQQGGGTTGRRGLSVRRSPSHVIQRSVADALRADRQYWKMLPKNVKVALVVAAPILGTFGQAWESGSEAASETYRKLAGDNPSVLRAVLSGLAAGGGAVLGGVYGLVKGVLNGITMGIGNPLYSMGKRVVERVQAIPEAINEARGIYNADPRGKYGNLADGSRRENYNMVTKYDIANYTLLATGFVSSTTAATTKGVEQISQQGIKGVLSGSTVPMLSETGQALSKMGAVSGIFGAATSLVDASKGYKQWRDTASTTRQQRQGLGMALSGTGSALQQSATAAYHFGNLAQSASTATAQVVTGGAGVATGAIDMLRGGYGWWKASQNIERLASLQQRPTLQGREGRDLAKAARQATSTQEMREASAKSTLAKGALTLAGGIMLAASAATPIGWALLSVGAVIGGLAALRRLWNKRTRKEEIAMRELKVTKTDREYWEKDVANIKKRTWWGSNERKAQLKDLGPDPLDRKLSERGFKSVGHFYANYINYMANYLHDEGVAGRGALEGQVRPVIEIMKEVGMTIRHAELDGRLSDLTYKQMKPRLDDEGIEVDMAGNHYPEVEEVLEGMGLRFNWRQIPIQPEPAKIGKALDE